MCRDMTVPVNKRDAALDYRVGQTRAAILAQWPDVDPPTALVCYDESLAAGVYAAIGELGLSIPEDVSVIGFDDVFARTFHPALTVGNLNSQTLGRDSADLLIRIINDPAGVGAYRKHRQLVPSELVIRSSTAFRE